MSLNDPNPPGTQGGQTTPSSIDAQEFARMQQQLAKQQEELAQYESFVQRIEPHAPRIRRLLEDDTAAQIYDDSLSAYDQLQAKRKPALAPEWNPEVNPYVAKIDKLAESMSKFEERFSKYDQQQQAAVNQAQVAELQQKATKLAEQYPVLRENDWRGIGLITSHSVQTGKSWDDAAKDLEYLYRGSNGAVNAPSLRPDAGAPGVPAASAPTGEVDMVARAAELIRHHQGLRG